jgi:hypothetical protein
MDFRYKSYIMGKLDPNLLLLLVAGAGGLWFYFKGGGREMLQGMTTGSTAPPATAVEPTEDTDPDPKAAAEEENTPEPRDPEAEEEWDDGKGNVYIIKIDGWMWVNNRRMYPPDHRDWDRFYRMRKYNWRYRRCMAKYRNHSWCKNKHKFCTGAWRNTPWCRGFKRGIPRRPPYKGGGGREWERDRDWPPRTPPRDRPGPDTNNCPPFIYKNGKKYRFTRDPMPDVMPAIFPPPYVKEGNCVYKLDNNQGPGQNGRDGWDGDRGGSSGGNNNWWDRLIGGTSFYTYTHIGNM